MVLPNWDALPVRTKRSRKRLYALLASEYSLTAWKSLPHNVKRSKKHLYNYIASQKNLEEYDELVKNNMRSTRNLYTYIKENASGSKPTLTVKVKSGESNVSGATVTIGTTEKTTDASGETTFTLDYDDYLVEVSKSGYVDYEENIKFRANHKSFTFSIEAEPVPPTPTTEGTVTVTCQDSEQTPLTAAISLEEGTYGEPDYKLWGAGIAGDDGTCVLKVPDEQDAPTEVTAEIPYGTYILYAMYNDGEVFLSYLDEAFVIDGDETVTITLLPEDEGGDD